MMERYEMDGHAEPDNSRESPRTEDHLIAWIETKTYADTDEVIYDFRKLAESVGFEVTRIEIEEPPFYGKRNELIKLFTNDFPEIPEGKAGEARKWLVKALGWTRYVIDADVRISGFTNNDKTKFLKEVKKRC